MELLEKKLSELKRVVRALRDLADDLAALALAWAGFVALILWLWR